jgi:hypothetical protein
MRAYLESIWSRREWHGLQRVRVIHGTGATLWRALRQWCDEKGIPWGTEPRNPGVTILHPAHRALPAQALPHRPLALLKRQRPAEKPPEEERAPPAPSEAAPPAAPQKTRDLMAEEFERLLKEDPRLTQKRKRG